jgi:hypothetical protein
MGAKTPALLPEPRTVIVRRRPIWGISNRVLGHRNSGAHHLVSASSGVPLRFGVVHFPVDLGRWVCYILLHTVAGIVRNSRRALGGISVSLWRGYGPGAMAQLAEPPVGAMTIGSSDRGQRLRLAREGVDV